MKTSLDHLPLAKRETLAAIVALFREALPKGLLELGEHNFGHWFSSAGEFWRGSRYYTGRSLHNHAAFLLHQATERYYHAASLVFTGYKERSHDIGPRGGASPGTMAALRPSGRAFLRPTNLTARVLGGPCNGRTQAGARLGDRARVRGGVG